MAGELAGTGNADEGNRRVVGQRDREVAVRFRAVSERRCHVARRVPTEGDFVRRARTEVGDGDVATSLHGGVQHEQVAAGAAGQRLITDARLQGIVAEPTG